MRTKSAPVLKKAPETPQAAPFRPAAPTPTPPASPLRLWKDGNRRGIAYVEGREMAERVLALAGRTLPSVTRTTRDAEAEMLGAMAVYRDRRGRAFAWQIPFDIGCWDMVASLAPSEQSSVV